MYGYSRHFGRHFLLVVSVADTIIVVRKRQARYCDGRAEVCKILSKNALLSVCVAFVFLPMKSVHTLDMFRVYMHSIMANPNSAAW